MKTALCPNCQSLHTPDGMVYDENKFTVSWPGGSVVLPRIRFRIMHALAQRSFRTKDGLVTVLWGERDEPNDPLGCIGVHICILRKLLRDSGFPGEIRTVFNSGYELIIRKPDQAAA